MIIFSSSSDDKSTILGSLKKGKRSRYYIDRGVG